MSVATMSALNLFGYICLAALLLSWPAAWVASWFAERIEHD